MSELKINNVSVLTESGGEVTGTLKTLKMGATTVFTESGGTVTAQNMGFSANDAGVKAALNASGDAPVYACRAWVNFDGVYADSGSTNTLSTGEDAYIKNHGNISAVNWNGEGQYTINFVTNMPHENYAVVEASNRNLNGTPSSFNNVIDNLSVSSFKFKTQNGTGNYANHRQICLAVIC